MKYLENIVNFASAPGSSAVCSPEPVLELKQIEAGEGADVLGAGCCRSVQGTSVELILVRNHRSCFTLTESITENCLNRNSSDIVHAH
jgi:hypothetical protein